MTKIIFFIGLLFSSSFTFAGSVDWTLQPMTFELHAENFDITEVEVYMSCTLSDGSDLFQDFPNVEIPAKLTNQNFAGNGGSRFLLETESAHLKASQVFAELQSCMVTMTVVSSVMETVVGGKVPVYREFGLAVASQDVQEFVSEDQASNIMNLYSDGFKMFFDKSSFSLMKSE